MPHRILIADDEPSLRFTLAFALQRAGYEVAVAADGREALVELRRCRPDLLLVEARLPGIDGVRLCRMVREDESLRDLPVVLTSALARESEVSQGHAAGADAWLAKPFSAQALQQRVEELLVRGHAPA